MSDRETILAAIRGAYGENRPAVAEISREYRAVMPQGSLTSLFVSRVEEYGVSTAFTTGDKLNALLAELVAGRSVIVPQGAPWSIERAVVDNAHSPHQLDAIAMVVTGAAVAIAQTGTVVLDHGPGQGRRALTLVPDIHVCVVNASQLVADVPQAVAILDPERPQTWISGPSATSDIELQRVAGVHGPRTLRIVLVEDA